MSPYYLRPYSRPTIPPLQRQFAKWVRAQGGDADDNLGATINHLLLTSYVFFGDDEEIFHRSHLELRGTLLKMERDHDNGKDLINSLRDNERRLPDRLIDGFKVSDFPPYITALTLYLNFLKSAVPQKPNFP
ncbi:MAG: hypothetical protein QM529_03005 [Hydrotalea sp.]|nr:hypothetical protein [Hydrotalea sp.]